MMTAFLLSASTAYFWLLYTNVYVCSNTLPILQIDVTMPRLQVIAAVIMLALSSVAVLGEDQQENCEFWANSGECDKNPDFMLQNCDASCHRVAQQALKDSKEVAGIKSFFDLSAKDIHGQVLEFSKYEGQVTILTNVASYCGYTDSHYKGMVHLWKQVAVSEQVNLLAFPCNQFGAQEPGSNQEIETFAKGYGVEFTMMDKIDVNGPNTSLVYKWLKAQTSVGNIGWNFAAYFVISPDGVVTAHEGVEPMELKDFALGMVDREL